eukprot:1126403-Prorocentrum_minimum.AAC.1
MVSCRCRALMIPNKGLNVRVLPASRPRSGYILMTDQSDAGSVYGGGRPRGGRVFREARLAPAEPHAGLARLPRVRPQSGAGGWLHNPDLNLI